jgi:dUTP pyrophosphatase
MLLDPVLQWRRVGAHTLPLPTRHAGGLGYDVAAWQSRWIVPGEVVRIGIGWQLAEPLAPHVGLFVLPRSSTRTKFTALIPNAPGLVDTFYGEELQVQLENVGTDDVLVQAGDRIAQLLFLPVVLPNMVETYNQDARMQRSGFGSTG